jgi:hypothetical protein
VSTIIEVLSTQLERPRDVTAQVTNYLLGNYEVEREGVGAFLEQKLPGLEDYEHDLILSPLFTPKLTDQAIVADLLAVDSIPRDQWPALVTELGRSSHQGHLVTTDGQSHAILLREVTVERYVYRLRLDGSIPESLFVLLENASTACRPVHAQGGSAPGDMGKLRQARHSDPLLDRRGRSCGVSAFGRRPPSRHR